MQCDPKFLLALLFGLCLAPSVSADEPRVFPYVLKYAWFDAHPTRHSDIHDCAVELEQPLSQTTRSVANISYSYPKHRRISFQFAWDRPPQVIEMSEGALSGVYAISLEARRSIGAEFVDESASIYVGSGGHSVSATVGDVCKRLRVERISPETFAETNYVGFREQNKHTAVQEVPGRFTLAGAGQNYIKNGILTADMRYAYIRIRMEARGGYGEALYVYENAAAGTGGDDRSDDGQIFADPEESVETLSRSAPASEPVLIADFHGGLTAPWGTGQYAQGRPAWWNRGNCNSGASVESGSGPGGRDALHIINRSARAPHVYGTTQQPLRLEPGKRYRVSVWARGNDLRSSGAVSIVVDQDWKTRPVQLPAGTYDWTELTGTFVASAADGQLRILIEDAGEVWLDQIQVVSE